MREQAFRVGDVVLIECSHERGQMEWQKLEQLLHSLVRRLLRFDFGRDLGARIDLDEALVPARIDPCDALFERRVGGEKIEVRHTRERGAHFAIFAVGKKQVARLLRVRAHDDGAFRESPNLLERAANPVRVARELHRRGVGEKFPLARDRALDDSAEENAEIADDDEQEPEKRDRHRGGSASSRSSKHAASQDEVADECDHENPVKHTHQAHVQSHVAVQNV